MKPKILFILHLPPPIHGAAMMGKYIQESELVNSSFDCFCINLATAGSLSDIGHISLKKLLKYFFLLKHIFYKRFFSNLKVILLAENLYKDMAKYVKREDVYICPNGIPNLRK